jgi:hypothetical protein
VKTTGNLSETASAIQSTEDSLEQRRQKRHARIERIRRELTDSLDGRLAFSPSEAGIACGRSPTWGYRKVYDGTFRLLDDVDGRMLIPRAEIDRFLSRVAKYAPQPKNGGRGNEGS